MVSKPEEERSREESQALIRRELNEGRRTVEFSGGYPDRPAPLPPPPPTLYEIVVTDEWPAGPVEIVPYEIAVTDEWPVDRRGMSAENEAPSGGSDDDSADAETDPSHP